MSVVMFVNFPGEIPTAMKKLAKTPVHAPPMIKCQLFITRDTNLPVKVVTEYRTVLDPHLPHIKELFQETTLKVHKKAF
jgi:hypothetical protein